MTKQRPDTSLIIKAIDWLMDQPEAREYDRLKAQQPAPTSLKAEERKAG